MWNYNKKVMDYFLNPKNVGEIEEPDGIGEVGNASCGDAMKLTFKLDENQKIIDAKFQTFGCASAIASSSALTEMIKGLTIEEAEKLTNNDIVEFLGELPDEKIHCSVMGVEALQAAIANYRGEELPIDDDDNEGEIVCKCYGITDNKIRKIALENDLHSASEITKLVKAGGACGACLNDIQNIIDDIWKKKNSATNEFNNLTLVQKIGKIQQVLDSDISPILAKDGGDIQLVDLKDNKVFVKLQGSCAHCAGAAATLKSVVETKLKQALSDDIEVESL